MARIDIDDDFWELVQILTGKYKDADLATGQALRFLKVAQTRFKHGRAVSADDFAIHSFQDHLKGVLAVEVPGGWMARDAESMFGWLRKRVEAGREGGKKSGESRSNKINYLAEANGSKLKQPEPSSSSSSSSGSKEPENISPDLNKLEEDEVHPLQWLVDLWNKHRGPMPSLFRISAQTQRGRHVAARLKKWPSPATWEEVFTRMEKSDFITGRSGQWAGGGFDWVMEREANVEKVLNGNYNPQAREVKRENFEDKARHLLAGIKRFSPHSSKDMEEFRKYMGELMPVALLIDGGISRVRNMRDDEFAIKRVAALLKEADAKHRSTK